MRTRLLIPGTLGPLAKAVAGSDRFDGFTPELLGPIAPEDVDAGLAHVDNDVCVSAVAAVGQYMRYLDLHPDEDDVAVLAPELCHDCRCTSTRSLLATAFARSGREHVRIVGLGCGEVRSATSPETGPDTAPDGTPVIGVCGNVPVLTTREFRHVVVDHLRATGCQVVLPPLQRIVDERGFFTPAIEFFDEADVSTVICILPFGCLGGHVYARGQLRRLQERFPHVDVTVLDYDPSASDINLVNRVELVVQAARERSR